MGKRHVACLQEQAEAELVALVETSPEVAAGLELYGVPVFASLPHLLAAGLELDVINICTPNGQHAEQTLQSLGAGKHVVVEKPLALRTTDAAQMIAAAQAANRELFVVMQNRYSPPAAWLKNMVASGVLGKIHLVQAIAYWNRDDRYYTPGSWHGNKDLDGGPLFTQFAHFIDMLYWVFGDINNIRAKFANFNHAHLPLAEDSGIITFYFISGGMGTFHYTTAVWEQNLESSLTVIAENGCLKTGGQYLQTVDYCHVKDYTLPEHLVNPAATSHNAGPNHRYVIQNVGDVVQKCAPVTTPAVDGLRVVDMIEHILIIP